MSKYQTVAMPLAGQIRGEDVALALGWDPDSPPKPGTGLMTPPTEEGLPPAPGMLQLYVYGDTSLKAKPQQIILQFAYRGFDGMMRYGEVKLNPITSKDAKEE